MNESASNDKAYLIIIKSITIIQANIATISTAGRMSAVEIYIYCVNTIENAARLWYNVYVCRFVYGADFKRGSMLSSRQRQVTRIHNDRQERCYLYDFNITY